MRVLGEAEQVLGAHTFDYRYGDDDNDDGANECSTIADDEDDIGDLLLQHRHAVSSLR